MKTSAITALALSATLALVACGSDDDSDGTGMSACEAAFAHAAAIADLEDTVENLDPAVGVCATLDEWTAASEAYPGALDGADPATYLSDRCLYGDSLAGTDLCQSIE